MSPPPLPPESIYTSCWCEENIYFLTEAFSKQTIVTNVWDIFIIFISNKTKTIALWNQKSAKDISSAVVWDYHVVLLLRSRVLPIGIREVYIYDFDSRTSMPCDWKDYFLHSFSTDIPLQYQSLFRVVPGSVFLNYFASDRSHMLRDGSKYISPPPEYDPVCGPRSRQAGVTNNLMSGFVSMLCSEGTYGDVFEMDEFIRWLER